MYKLLIIVPAYNEEASLRTTIEMLRTQPHDFVIVNDGSTDRTAQIAEEAGALAINLPFNQGLAGAFLAGMQYAATHGYSHAIQFDADGQHLPEYITPMLQTMAQDGADIMIGSRFLDAPMPRSLRMLGSSLIRLMMKLTTGQHLTDPTSGMRMYNRRMIELFSSRTDLTPEPDTLAFLMRNETRVDEFPVKMQERLAGVSYLSSFAAVKYMARMVFSIMMIQFVRGKIRVQEAWK
ncbi:MAG: glycosyltransferase family 2 protein [Ruminococcaceae bacterium]|nr:glycosyltransferase family 2 protein [Oscillospiraceae bacterium]